MRETIDDRYAHQEMVPKSSGCGVAPYSSRTP